ncbi:alpha/beta hydrolase [Companilactobacillus metriopterae]|uniref:alpha/beta hydrolase n=1 Tax=Companilactobacillus metriopterae TaxID=1909267 RepID=UPI00100C166B|nr:alpha/beta hydrolase-fold protein [Companilactobacillus metriopterae]
MALNNLSFRTNYLHTYFNSVVIIPDDYQPDYPVVWLLAGYTSDETTYVRHVNLEKIAREYKCAIIMPETRNAFYTDSDFIPYYSFFINEYMKRIQNIFPISKDRENNYIVGSSMGGYGALKIAFKNSTLFSKVVGLSPIADILKFRNNPKCPMPKEAFDNIFKTNNKIKENQLINIFDEYKPDIDILTICGDQDFMYEDNVELANFLKKKTSKYSWKEVTGDHSWETWSQNIDYVFDWIFNK